MRPEGKTSKCCVCGKRKIRLTEMYVYHQGRFYEKALMACLSHKEEKSIFPNHAVFIAEQNIK